MKSIYILLIPFCCLLSHISFAQGQKKVSEQIQNDLLKKIEHTKTKDDERNRLIKIYIAETKKKTNLLQLYNSYALAAKYQSGHLQLSYGDSLIQVAKKIGTPEQLADAYIAKGMTFVNNENYNEALNYYLKANHELKKINNPYLFYNLEYNIAQANIYLGKDEEARAALIKSISFFRKNHQQIEGTDYRLYYVYALISLVDTNIRLGYYPENIALIDEGKKFIKVEKLPTYLPYFLSSEAIQDYYLKRYDLAIGKFITTLSLYNDQWKHLTDHYYLGLSYWDNHQKEQAIEQFLLIDEEYTETGSIDPFFRPAFEKLYQYSIEKKDNKKQLEYIDKLLTLNKKYEKEYKVLHTKLTSEFDMAQLNTEKQRLQKSLSLQKKLTTAGVGLAVIFLIGFIYYYLKNKKRKKQYQLLYEKYISNGDVVQISENQTQPDPITSTHSQKTLRTEDPYQENEESSINPLITDQILAVLHQFENEQGFLSQDVTLKSLAIQCGTNTTYLSKIINWHKGMNFNAYINDLRLEHVMKTWKTSPKSRYLSIQETAANAGYSTAQSFSKNFTNKYQLSPTYFLKQLNQENG